ncbi:MAG: outer membrane lipoprotein chaperone LolA [Gammaproteobacteria bacterium]|jgi:outer membrane lipoprotein carrier protein|nr:outer membrane lipoprotein chaperone LolA [Gammaproteobacteria bacterium]
MIKRTKIYICGILGLLFSVSVLGDSAAQQLTQQLGRYQSLQADFVQYLLDASGSRLQETRGQMQLLQPNKFYWKTEDPFAQTIVSNGQEVWIYDPDLEQVTWQKLDTRVTATPALLLSGDQQMIAQQFKVRLAIGTDGMQQFDLLPKDPESLYQSMRLFILDGKLKQMQVVDTLQQKTAMHFHNLVLGADLPDEHFQFQIPTGTDVIDMR